tara:strand:- start:918 stop:1577 length:660 start_codon:yes stop_codon:yes gene_type:complete
MQNSYFKKIISLFFLIFTFLSNNLNSQFEIGVKGGLSFNAGLNQDYFFESENMSYNLFEKNNGYHVGLYTKIKLLKSFFVQPEIYYSSINRKYDLTFPADHEKYIVDEYRHNRIIIPVLVGIDLFDRVSLFLGPNFNFNSKMFFEENTQEISIDDLYEKSKIYLQYGLSVKFKKLIIDFRVERGFDEREIKFVENITNDIDQIVKSDGLLTMMSIGYQF